MYYDGVLTTILLHAALLGDKRAWPLPVGPAPEGLYATPLCWPRKMSRCAMHTSEISPSTVGKVEVAYDDPVPLLPRTGGRQGLGM
jgi:hypothetical protein